MDKKKSEENRQMNPAVTNARKTGRRMIVFFVACVLFLGWFLFRQYSRSQACAYPGCARWHEVGSVYCPEHQNLTGGTHNASYELPSSTASTTRTTTTGTGFHSHARTSAFSDNDEYDVKNYDHPDDFYYDHEDDFLDYEDANDYFEEYGG